MAHEIEGDRAFFTGEPAWHGLGTVLKDAPTLQDAWHIAYPHELFKLETQAFTTDDAGNVHTVTLPEHRAIVRDDGKVLGVVGQGFEIVQPWDAMKVFEPLMESGLVELEAGGSLRDGKRMWALGKVKDSEAEVLKNDLVSQYFLMATGFDGSLSHTLIPTNVRAVCNNTLRRALSQNDSGVGFKIRHTKSIHDNIQRATQQIHAAHEQFRQDVEAYRHLAKKQVTDSQVSEYVTEILAPKKIDADKDAEISTRKENQIRYVINLVHDQREKELIPAISGTAWQAYNAVTRYLTHDYGNSQDTRLNAQWFGESAAMNRRALDLALSL